MRSRRRPSSQTTGLLAALGLLIWSPGAAIAETPGVDEAVDVQEQAVLDEAPAEAVVPTVDEEEAALEEAEALLEEEEVEAEGEPSEPGPSKPWGVSVNAGTSQSMAMFHPTEYVRSYGRSLSLSMGASARYSLTDNVSASASAGAAYHAVNPKDLSGRRFFLSDPSFGVSHSSLFRDEAFTGIGISGGLNASVGLSPASRYWNRYGSLSGSLSANRPFLDRRITASYRLSGGVSFSRYTSPTTKKASDEGLDMALARAAGAELLAGDYNLVSGNAQLGSLGNTLSLSVRAVKGLTANLSFGVSHSYRYCPPIDHLSSDAVDQNGDRIVQQGDVCRSDGMIGSFGASYSLPDGYSISASFSSAQPVFAYRGESVIEENRVLRFPWWDRDLHMTSFALRASKSF